MLQRFFEVDNTFGTRIREKLAGHFGVHFPDETIQIPRIVGHSSTKLDVQEVLQTSSSLIGQPLGSYAGRSTGRDVSHHKRYYCVEHGYMMSLLSIIPSNMYCNGTPRSFFKQNFFEFASPEFNNIGWQDIWKGELFPSHSDDKKTWGYQPRYSEYRSHPSRVSGQFRNSAELAWHLGRNFSELPPLNANFLKVADTDRIFSGSSEEDANNPIYIKANIDSKMFRPISYEPDCLHIY